MLTAVQIFEPEPKPRHPSADAASESRATEKGMDATIAHLTRPVMSSQDVGADPSRQTRHEGRGANAGPQP